MWRSPWRRGVRAALAAALMSATAWLVVAPAVHVAADWAPAGTLPGLGSGLIWSVAVAPQNPNIVIAGTDNGVYRSSDGAATWSQATLAGVRVWVVGFDPRSHGRLFAGTHGQGIRASSDLGATWSDASAGLPSLNVRSMAFSLSQVAAGTEDGVALSSDGKSWVRGGLAGTSISALAVVANSPALTLIAGTDNGDTAQGYLWTNSGSTWQVDRGSGLPGPGAVSAIASGTVSKAIAHRPVIVDTNQGTFRSLDMAQTWSPATNLPAVGTQTLALTTSAFSPLDPSLVYGGADAAGSSGGAIMRSSDAGVTYTDIAQGLPTDQRNVITIAVAQTTPPTLYIAVGRPNAGGAVFKLTDKGAPPPPKLVPESPGASIPAAVATPTPTARHTAAPSATPKPSSGGGLSGFIGGMFHWPQPLVYELIVLLLLLYGYLRWRQRAYVEGPP